MFPFKFVYMQHTKANSDFLGRGRWHAAPFHFMRSAVHWLPKSFHTFSIVPTQMASLGTFILFVFLQKRSKICHNSQDVLLEIGVRSRHSAYWPRRPCGVFS